MATLLVLAGLAVLALGSHPRAASSADQVPSVAVDRSQPGATMAPATGAAEATPPPANKWPPGTEFIDFENLEGLILVPARLQAARRETTGVLVFDTGAGFLVLAKDLARWLGIADETEAPGSVGLASRPLNRLELGARQIDQVSPVLTAELEVVRRAADRPLLGLLGERLFRNQAVAIDYQRQRLALVPIGTPPSAVPPAEAEDRVAASRAALGGVLPNESVAIPFEIEGDGKLLVRARLANPDPARMSDELNLVIDTGATKCVLFEEALERRVRHAGRWASMRGLAIPTLLGVSDSRVVRIPAVEVAGTTESLVARDLDAAVMQSELSGILSRVVGRTVHGLLGYSFLKRHRLVLDYPHRLMWLEPLAGGWNDRPHEYSHVGIQLERDGAVIRVLAVIESSPAAAAGIRAGDVVVSVEGRPAAESDVTTVTQSLEGPPGSKVRVTLRRGSSERTHVLVRRRLL